MGVKPFCINIEGMSDGQVEGILSKAIAAGGILEEGLSSRGGWKYFGLDYELETYFWGKVNCYAEDEEEVPELTLDQLDEYLGLISKSTQKETIMTSEITDMKNTAILLEGLDEDTIQAYIKMCGDCGYPEARDDVDYDRRDFVECCDPVGDGDVKIYSSGYLESDTKIITIEKQITYIANLPERKTVTLFGAEYYEDMLAPMLSTMEDAKVSDVTPSAGSGTPPIKKSL